MADTPKTDDPKLLGRLLDRVGNTLREVEDVLTARNIPGLSQLYTMQKDLVALRFACSKATATRGKTLLEVFAEDKAREDGK